MRTPRVLFAGWDKRQSAEALTVQFREGHHGHRQMYSNGRSDDEVGTDTNLDHVFSLRTYRQIGTGNTLSYGSKVYTLADPTPPRKPAADHPWRGRAVTPLKKA